MKKRVTDKRIAEIEAKISPNVWSRDRFADELLQALKAEREVVTHIGNYANTQADMAHSRLLKNDKPLYDDTYWQPVLDIIRFELFNVILNKEKAPKNEASQ